MQEKKPFLSLFTAGKPIFGMLHLKGEDSDQVLKRAVLEAEQMIANGVSAVIVENYFGTVKDVEMVLQHFYDNKVSFVYGVNVLHDDSCAFKFAKKYEASFIQLDSVSGHLSPQDDVAFEEFIIKERSEYNGYVLGGVRFKYQPYLSGRSLQEDLRLGMERCDAIVVTGESTGADTPMDKIQEFRDIMGDFPLVVGAGMTPETCKEHFLLSDAAIVGSCFKDTRIDSGDVDPKHVQEFMKAVNAI